jgi:predicted component of type VI protein secretion system
MPSLRIRIPGHGDETRVVSGPRVTIGRRPENTIQILDPSVSAFHAELLAEQGHYRLRDLASTNRTFLGGQPIVEKALMERCAIVFGKVECEYDPSSGVVAAPLSGPEMERELQFLRAENAELREHQRALERRIEILGSAQIIGEKRDRATNRDALTAELEQTRDELAVALRERDAARAAAGMLHSEKASILREIGATGVRPPVPPRLARPTS